MKVLVVCSMGLGSSFMIEINVKRALKELGIEGVSVGHSDVSSAKAEKADIYVAPRDIVDNIKDLGEVVSLNNVVSMEELKEKLVVVLKRKGIL